MKSDYSTMQYALFPYAFHYITEQNVKITTRGITLQIMKNDDVSISKFREDMASKWQNLDEESGNPLALQYLVTVGCGANLGSAVMRSLFHQQNQIIRNAKCS
jgi:hypothetical protein